ncbi:hypothetical protein CEXT_472991 [Caerostris extrusa]|uniref:Uncharacterized protein n=1 Tax=Caerostris extrusa TaxID=172846 RepID=A0AAV4X7Y1_CAEEX|nr:hypothetical protein CEXT_472991 [Caerostris extrusa]
MPETYHFVESQTHQSETAIKKPRWMANGNRGHLHNLSDCGPRRKGVGLEAMGATKKDCSRRGPPFEIRMRGGEEGRDLLPPLLQRHLTPHPEAAPFQQDSL